MFHMGGAVSRLPEAATAFGNRQASYAISINGVWRSGEDYADGDIDWTRRFFAALEQLPRGRLRQLP